MNYQVTSSLQSDACSSLAHKNDQPLKFASVFSDDMVLQRNHAVIIWGEATPNEQIQLKFNHQSHSTQADIHGDWRVTLEPMNALNIGCTLTVKDSHNEITLSNVVIGEVWLCSGQSNMGWTLDLAQDAERHINQAHNQLIRCLAIPVVRSDDMQTSIEPSKWNPSHPDHTRHWSAVGYHFAEKLYQELQVPIGLIWASLGATKIQEWTSTEINALHPYEIAEEWNNNSASSLFNGMIAPLIPFTIRGVAWYQGEENHWGAGLYQTQQSAMIEDWRERWCQGSFPFIYVQLANYGQTHTQPWSAWAELQEAQLHGLDHPNTAMAIAIDLGEADDIHPKRKQPVGERLALAALGKVYNECEIYSGPLFRAMKIEGDKIRVLFDHIGEGLKSSDALPLRWFEIAGEKPLGKRNSVFLPALAEIDRDSILLSNPNLRNPIAARYAFNNNPEGCNLCNSADLPASPFRTSNDWSATIGNHPLRPLRQPPVATHQRIDASSDFGVRITLKGQWSRNSPPTSPSFKVLRPPLLGELKGEPPHLFYQAFEDSYGTDSFSYCIEDAEHTSNSATIILDL